MNMMTKFLKSKEDEEALGKINKMKRQTHEVQLNKKNKCRAFPIRCKVFFQLITKVVKHTSIELSEENKYTTKAIEELMNQTCM